MARSNQQPVVIRKVENIEDGGHHGGAWKVAYADFMTAMMAFFLLLWILSTATKDQLSGIANYFTPSTVSMTSKGGTGLLSGTSFGPNGTLGASNGVATPKGLSTEKPKDPPPAPQPAAAVVVAAAQPPAANPQPPAANPAPVAKAAADAAAVAKAAHAADDRRFAKVETEITQAMQSAPDLRPLLKNVLFERSPDGLNIQVVDQAGKAMFPSGSAKIEGPTLTLMQGLARAVEKLPNDILISGHTDAVPYSDGASHDNWELSSNRANATRRVFVAAGVDPGRITRISGLADTDPLKPEDPLDPSNRRISVLLAYLPGQGKAVPQGSAQTAPKGSATAAPAATAASPEAAPAAPAAPRVAPAPVVRTIAEDPIAQQYSSISLDDLRKSLK